MPIVPINTGTEAGDGTGDPLRTMAEKVNASFDEIVSQLALKAALAGPIFTGVPQAPTASPGTNTAQLSTTAFVQAALAAQLAGDIATALALKAPLASPALTGNPTAPTQTAGDSTTKLATTAFVSTAVAASGLRGYLSGLTLANNSGTPNTHIDIGAGVARDTANTYTMALAATLTKRIDQNWALGASGGWLDTGSKTNSTWYHAFIIARSDTNVVESVCSLSATSPTMPSSYDKSRRIGSVYVNASGNIDAFVQNGDDFIWNVNPTPSTSSTGLISASGTLFTLRVPPGIVVNAVVNFWFADGVSSQVYLSSPLSPDLSCAATSGRADAPHTNGGGQKTLLTNTSGQIRARGASGTSGQIYLATIGWRDPLGRN